MRVTIKTKSNLTPFKKLIKQVNSKVVKVGWLDSKEHWTGGLSVADVAAIQHFDGSWGESNSSGSFALDESQKNQVKAIVNQNIHSFGMDSIENILIDIGEDAVATIRYNILSASSPPNSESWAQQKGFNDPLVYGSGQGEEPNLYSEVKFKVGPRRD